MPDRPDTLPPTVYVSGASLSRSLSAASTAGASPLSGAAASLPPVAGASTAPESFFSTTGGLLLEQADAISADITPHAKNDEGTRDTRLMQVPNPPSCPPGLPSWVPPALRSRRAVLNTCFTEPGTHIDRHCRHFVLGT